jgi:hypothetical protein
MRKHRKVVRAKLKETMHATRCVSTKSMFFGMSKNVVTKKCSGCGVDRFFFAMSNPKTPIQYLVDKLELGL